MFKLYCSNEITGGTGPDSLSSSLPRHGTVALTDAITSLINTSISSFYTPKCWRPATTVSIPKSSISAALVIHSFYCLNISRSDTACYTPALSLFYESFWKPHLICLSICQSTWDAVAYLIHHICKSLDASMKHVHRTLDYSSAFDSVSVFLLHKIEIFGCPGPLLAWLSDYFPTEPSACECSVKRHNRWLTTQACFMVLIFHHFTSLLILVIYQPISLVIRLCWWCFPLPSRFKQ